MPPLIALVTDFGLEGPYTGQMIAVLQTHAPQSRVVSLFADAPVHDPIATSYLLAAYCRAFAAGTVFVCVVDPGVGSGADRPVVVRADGRWYVGPDNGLFHTLIRQASSSECWEIEWPPERLSASFHGRDLYAPVAALLANGNPPPGPGVLPSTPEDWPLDRSAIIYIDHFGNAMTGLRPGAVAPGAQLEVHGRRLRHALTFASVGEGEGFWYENSNGLLEIAVNRGRADESIGLRIGDRVTIVDP